MDKYFGINKTADYHDLVKIIDSVFYAFWFLFVGPFAAFMVVTVGIALFRNHKSLAKDPSSLELEAPPAAPESHTPPDDPAPDQPAEPKP